MMKTVDKIAVFLLLVTITIMQGCAGSESLAGNQSSREYSEDYEKMKDVVQQALRASNLNINYVDESEDGNTMMLSVGRNLYTGSDTQQEKGAVRIIKKDSETTIVEVENPDYHFSVPTHQKENYQRIVFGQIDNILEK